MRSGGDAFDWYVAAMAHHRLGNEAEARDLFERARDGMAGAVRFVGDLDFAEELFWFEAEAEALLGAR